MSKSLRNTLSGLVVGQAMRRQVVQLIEDATIDNSINALIKYKVNALLTTDRAGRPVGVLSKTDIMGAYYAGLPIGSPVADIMSRPPFFCSPEDALDKALKTMRSRSIYRLYVMDPDKKNLMGSLAYPDIVGLLYKYCHDCEYSHSRQKAKLNSNSIKRFSVKEIMTNEVKSVTKDDSLVQVMEALSVHHFGAILIKDRVNVPCGVVSKTDLVLAYKHGIDSEAPAESIMSSPVQCCRADELLEDAIRTMIFSDIQRLYVYQLNPHELVGILSLSDAARVRSGSCHACISSRIKIGT